MAETTDRNVGNSESLDAKMLAFIKYYESVSPGTLEAMAKAEAED